MIQLGNFWYIFFIVLLSGAIVGLYFLLRNKTDKTKKIVLGALLFFNLALHFLKLTFPPYSTNPELAMREVWFVNVCGTSVLLFPFIFISDVNKPCLIFGFLNTTLKIRASVGFSVFIERFWKNGSLSLSFTKPFTFKKLIRFCLLF